MIDLSWKNFCALVLKESHLHGRPRTRNCLPGNGALVFSTNAVIYSEWVCCRKLPDWMLPSQIAVLLWCGVGWSLCTGTWPGLLDLSHGSPFKPWLLHGSQVCIWPTPCTKLSWRERCWILARLLRICTERWLYRDSILRKMTLMMVMIMVVIVLLLEILMARICDNNSGAGTFLLICQGFDIE